MSSGASEASDLATVMAAWERMLEGLPPAGKDVRSLIYQSWHRSLSSGVSPDRAAAQVIDEDSLDQLQRRRTNLIEVARPIMAQAKDMLGQTGTVMALTDADGTVLWVEGDERTLEQGKEIGLVPGGRFDEAVIGTNGIGTAIAVGAPVQIRAYEHFCGPVKMWTCSGAPIRDPADGQILGVLDISGVEANHSHCLALAAAEAHRIELSLARADAERHSRLLSSAFGPMKRWMDGGVVIFDHSGRVVHANRHANRFLTERGLPETFWQSSSIRIALRDNEFAGLPEWFDRNWIEPISEGGEVLGAVLAVPSAPAPSSRQPLLSDALRAVIGDSPAMAATKAKAQQLARLNTPVLLLGPTGVGKEVFARAIHESGTAAGSPLVPVNCGAFTRELLASELFGYADGAFTGARRGGAIGKFEAANGGTLFLDEIGEMPLDLQAYLLRVIEDGVIYRIGENKPRRVTVRLIAATNRDLLGEVEEKRFRSDLYYRLAVAQLRIPSLTERREDIPSLADHFADDFARRQGQARKIIAGEVMSALTAHDWRGNVRELRNVVEIMCALAPGDRVELSDLPATLSPASASPGTETSGDGLNRAKEAAIREAIRAAGGNLTQAARRLGVAKSTLYQKIRRYGIEH